MNSIARCLLLFLALGGIYSAQAQDQLVLVSPHWEGIRKEFEAGFIDHIRHTENREVSFKWLDIGGGTSDIYRFIVSEFSKKPEGIGIDLFFGGGIEVFQELKKRNLLARTDLPAEVLANVQPSLNGVPLYDPEKTWFAVGLSGFGIIFNKRVLPLLGIAAPASWLDLAAPAAYSWLTLADPRKSGSAHVAYEVILQAYGWEHGWRILSAIAANARNFTAAASQMAHDVAHGEAAMAVSIDSYAWTQMDEAGPETVGFIIPQNLSVVTGDLIAVLKGAPNNRLAQEFISYSLSESGQRLLLQRSGTPGGPKSYQLGKFSVLPSLYDKAKDLAFVKANPFHFKSSFVYDSEKAAQRWSILNDLIGTLLIDSHDSQSRVWHEYSYGKETQAALQSLPSPPLSEDEALKLASKNWQESRFRSTKIREWEDALVSAYGRPSTAWMKYLPSFGILLLVVWAMGRRMTHSSSSPPM